MRSARDNNATADSSEVPLLISVKSKNTFTLMSNLDGGMRTCKAEQAEHSLSGVYGSMVQSSICK